MQQSIVEFNEIAKKLGLTCTLTGGTAQKLSFVGLEGSGNLFKLSLTWNGDVIIDSFEGCITTESFCETLTKLSKEIKKLKL